MSAIIDAPNRKDAELDFDNVTHVFFAVIREKKLVILTDVALCGEIVPGQKGLSSSPVHSNSKDICPICQALLNNRDIVGF